MRMTAREMREVLEQCTYPGYTFHLTEQMYEAPYLVAQYLEEDVEADKGNQAEGAMVVQTTRRWLLHPGTTRSELAATAFKCVLTSLEHRCREHFRFMGRAVYQPHQDVDVLVNVCDRAAELRRQAKGMGR